MAQPFSEETQALLDRAERAIDHAKKLREHTRESLADAELRYFLFEMMLARDLHDLQRA